MTASTPAMVAVRGERRALAELIAQRDGRVLVVVGVANGAEARLLHVALAEAMRAGAIPAYVGGFITFVSGFLTAADQGLPDLGLLSRELMAAAVDRVEQATWLASIATDTPAWPIGADIDTGYGEEPSAVVLSCRQVHKQGAAYVQIEDQRGLNKSCGHMQGPRGTGKEVVDLTEMLEHRLRPALAYARAHEGFFVMARTDARGPLGIDQAIARAEAFASEGAPMVFVEAPHGEQELHRVADAFRDTDVLNAANMVEGSRDTPLHSVAELHAMGFSMALFPVGARLLAADALECYYSALARDVADGRVDPADDRAARARFERYTSVLGRDQILAWNALLGRV